MISTSRLKLAIPIPLLMLTGLLIIWLAFALRVHELNHDSLWVDEILTVWFSWKEPRLIFQDLHHPPLFYAITFVGMTLFGNSDFAARASALMAGTLSIALTIALGRTVGRLVAGLWAGLLLAISAAHVKFSQEARQYALLTAITLLSYILLYRALKRPRWSTWIAYALVTVLALYTHYAALIILISQVLLIIGWLLMGQHWRRIGMWLYPVTAALIVVILYIPQMRRLLFALQRNVGAELITDTGTVTPINVWFINVIKPFGMYVGWMPYLVLTLVLLGLFILGWQRDWLTISLLLVAVILPIPIVVITDVARGAFFRYVLFMLPFYLFAAAIVISEILMATSRVRFGNSMDIAASLITAISLLYVAWPSIYREYQYITEDWRGIINYLDQNADEGDVILTLTMNHNFNLVAASMPRYLAQANKSYHFLKGKEIDQGDAADLKEIDGNVWVVISHWAKPTEFENPSLKVAHFQTDLHVVHDIENTGNALESAIELYEQILPFASTPFPLCFLQLDLANLYFAADNPRKALSYLDKAASQCPDEINSQKFVAKNEHQESREKFASALASGNKVEVHEAALELIQYEPKHPEALAVLTFKDLGQQIDRGEAILESNGAPEPVELRQFIMPHNGDWSDVIFLHPPASATFIIELPAEPVALRSRVALDPLSWEWGGDGVTFVVTIKEEQGAPVDVFRHHVPNDESGHDWHDVYVPLTKYAGQTVMITLRTEIGQAGDGTGDWAGWEIPRLLWDIPDVDQEMK